MRIRRLSKTTDNTSIALALGLIAIVLAIVAIGLANVATQITNSGTATCTIPINGSSCTTATITFANPYTNNPLISKTASLSPLAPGHQITTTGATTINVINYQVPQNHTRLIFDDETAHTITIPNVDTILKSYNPNNALGNAVPVISTTVEGEGYITTAAASTKQVITITIEDCSIGGIFQTMKFEVQALAVGITPFSIKAVMPVGAFGLCDSINVTAPAADANTSITLVSLRVYLIETNFDVWANMPTTQGPTQISGINGNNIQEFFFTNTPSSVFEFCVNVVSLSVNATAFLTVMFHGVEISSNLRMPVGSNGIPGFQCTTANVVIAGNPCPFGCTTWVAGGFGNGNGDMPAFGAITLTWTQTASLSFIVPVGYGILLVAVTPTSFQLKLQFDATITAANTVTFTWSATGT